ASVLVGVALTCQCGPADNLALFAALATAQPGDILVAATDGFTATSVTGELVRDVAGILAVDLPVYCAGITANSPVRNGPGAVGLQVVLGGATVASGDLVIGDNDGIVIVPRDQIGAVLKKLPDIRAAEAALEAKVKGGLEVPDFIRTILESDRVVEL